MILPRYSYLLAGLLPDARVKIYPDSAHGFLFQHHSEFAADVNAFLAEPADADVDVHVATRSEKLSDRGRSMSQGRRCDVEMW